MQKYWYAVVVIFCDSSVQAMNIQEKEKTEEKMEKMAVIHGSNNNSNEYVITIKPIDYDDYMIIECRKSNESEQEREQHECLSGECGFDVCKCCVGTVGCSIILALLLISKMYAL